MKLSKKHFKIGAVMVGTIAIVLLAFSIKLPSGTMTAGKLLDKEIELQQQKQSMLDQIEVLDKQILEVREQRNELHKQEVCQGSGCYISSF